MSVILNEIILSKPSEFNERLLRYISDSAVELNLLVMADKVMEMDYKKSPVLLKEVFASRLDRLSKKDRDNLSRVSSIIRYRHHQDKVTHGLMVTFGKTPGSQEYESTFKNDIERFIRGMNEQWSGGLVKGVSMPILRLAILIHAMRGGIKRDLQDYVVQEYAMIDLNNNNLRFVTPTENHEFGRYQYAVDVQQIAQSSSSFSLRVRRPNGQMRSKDGLLSTAVCHNESTGFTFLELDKKLLYVDKTAKRAKYLRSQNNSKPLSKNIDDLADTISPLEAYWDGILYDLLIKAGVEYENKLFTPDLEFKIKEEYAKSIAYNKDWLGLELDEELDRKSHALNVYIQPSEVYDEKVEKAIENIGELGYPQCSISHEDNISEKTCKKNEFFKNAKISFRLCKSIEKADIVLGRFHDTGAASWLNSPKDAALDQYGQFRRGEIDESRVSTKQFIDYTSLVELETARQVLQKSVIECLMKSWASKEQFSSRMTLNWEAGNSATTKLLALYVNKKEVAGTKRRGRKPSNYYGVMYRADIENGEVKFSNLSLHQDLSLDNDTGEFDLDSYLMNRTDSLKDAGFLVRMIAGLDDNTYDHLMEDIGETFPSNDTVYLFEHDGEKLLSVWCIKQGDLWAMPEAVSNFPEDGSFIDFLKVKIAEKAFTRTKGVSEIYQDFRRSRDAHYQVSLESSTAIIRRLVYNPSLGAGTQRHMIRRAERLYPFTDVKSEDLALIYAGLLPDGFARTEQSGSSQLLYEKIAKIAISDAI